MPDVSQDLAGFSFSPLQDHIMDLGYSQHNPQITGDIRPQGLPMEGFEVSSFVPPPAQAIADFAVTESGTFQADASKPHDSHDLPLLVEARRRTRQLLTVDDVTYSCIRRDLAQRLTLPDHELDIPSSKSLQGFLSSYVTNFHSHLPIIHLQTLCPESTPSPLILAMCCIGALYRLDRRRSRKLYDIAQLSVGTVRFSQLPNGYLCIFRTKINDGIPAL